jgi:hypothetical protein
MIEAGVEEFRLIDWDSANLSYDECVTDIYRAMVMARDASETLARKT